MRLDILLVEKDFFPSREKAKLAITDGKIIVNGNIVNKPAFEVSHQDSIEVTENQLLKYVSLGGLKLEKAIQTFHIDFTEKKVLDIGASTGGFTDCALQHGANFVYAVDVGSDQLHYSLVNHAQIASFENQNIKDFELPELVDIIIMDVSFTSQISIFPFLKHFLKENGLFITLIKPQFELDQRVRFSNGIVSDKKLHLKVLQNIVRESAQNGLFIQDVCTAPISPKKNVEYLAVFKNIPPAKLINLKEVCSLR